jgi:hypothetical protein
LQRSFRGSVTLIPSLPAVASERQAAPTIASRIFLQKSVISGAVKANPALLFRSFFAGFCWDFAGFPLFFCWLLLGFCWLSVVFWVFFFGICCFLLDLVGILLAFRCFSLDSRWVSLAFAGFSWTSLVFHWTSLEIAGIFPQKPSDFI